MVEALYEHDHGEQQYNVMLSGPITDKLSGRIAVRYDAMDGWWDNVITGEDGPDMSNWYARGSIRWLPTDTLEVIAKYEYGDFDRDLRPTVIYQSDFAGQENFLGTVPFPVISDRDKGASNISPGKFDQESDSWAVFGQATWNFTNALRFSLGVRYNEEDKGLDKVTIADGLRIRALGATFLANPITGELTGESVPGSDPSVLNYDDETVTSYEVGAKMSLLGGAAELNVAVFRMEYDDLQTSSLVGDVFRVGNAGGAISQGVEVDGRVLLSERLSIGAAVAYLDAYYDDFKGATCTIPQANDPANNPGCLREDGSNIQVPLESGGQDLDPNTKHDDATKINARIALGSVDGTWSVAVIGKNLTDEKTYIWNNDVPITNSNSYYGLPDRPRSIAVQARYRF